MSKPTTPPRKSITVTQELLDEFREVVPYGLHNRILRCLMWDLIEAIKKDPKVLVYLVQRAKEREEK